MRGSRQPSPLAEPERSHSIAILIEAWGREYQKWQASLYRLDVRGLFLLNRSVLDDVGPGVASPSCEHTMRNYQSALDEAKVSSSENVESWDEAAADDMRLSALKRWHTLLEPV